MKDGVSSIKKHNWMEMTLLIPLSVLFHFCCFCSIAQNILISGSLKKLLLRFLWLKQFDGYMQTVIEDLDVHIHAIHVDECCLLSLLLYSAYGTEGVGNIPACISEIILKKGDTLFLLLHICLHLRMEYNFRRLLTYH